MKKFDYFNLKRKYQKILEIQRDSTFLLKLKICIFFDQFFQNTCKKSKDEEWDSSGVIDGHKSDIKFRQSDVAFRTVEWVNALMFGYIHHLDRKLKPKQIHL